ncbi:ABC transporter substrate-binding protein [Blastococcus sp. VKM Ac-2987]|uniref:ABC transporter substrate-binding protein n=1 Tax=Blastococcus sp. VKM Ac-2987 TaxID=3004141 RepID=UPI0022AB7CBE|nr:ABC transporter substrate-binding protein [Blastococcus sp. VKM Ac-2987]MCZ2860777.1 ABC transporter substrate-binding protein [Blastococcus sp. VKM Ac-2987]
MPTASPPSSLLRRSVSALAPLALVAAVAGCTSTGASTDDGGGAQVVTVGTLRGQPHFYAPYLYEEHAEGDVEFEVVALETAPALNDALASGSVDFAVGSITASIAGAAAGRDVRIVAAAADGGSGIIGTPEIESVRDLVGKRMGYLESSSQLVALRLVLEREGVDVEDVELVSLSAPEFYNAFSTGQIDAFAAPEIGVSLALGAGGHVIADPYSTEIGRLNIALLTTGGMIEENPDLVQAVVDTHAATTAYMVGNQDEWLPEMIEEYGGDQAVLESALENFWLRADLSPTYEEQIGNLAAQMARLGMIAEAPALEDVVDASFASRDEPAGS